MTILKKPAGRLELPKLAIFDMDGLLFDTERVFMDCQAKIHAKYGYDLKFDDYVRLISLFGES